MPGVFLAPVCGADLDALLAFEVGNRAFFEARINARPAGYYAREAVAAAIGAAEADARAGLGFQYLVRDDAGQLVGRVNFSRVRRAHFHAAELGYRIGEAFNGRGHATAAVQCALMLAFGELGLRRVEAMTMVGNAGSIRVLERNGFQRFGRSTRSFELGGHWHDTLHFERHADQAADATAPRA